MGLDFFKIWTIPLKKMKNQFWNLSSGIDFFLAQIGMKPRSHKLCFFLSLKSYDQKLFFAT
jgi:hypothetical protein